MKKLLSIIITGYLISSLVVFPTWATTYYAQGAGNMSAVEWDTASGGGGTYLTTVKAGDAGSGTTLSVVDALYFQDGTWGSDLARATFNADWICVGSATNCVQIDTANPINYTTNTITLVGGVNRTVGDGVWLYKKSDGERVFYGTAPDYGAHEYNPGNTTIGGAASATIGGNGSATLGP